MYSLRFNACTFSIVDNKNCYLMRHRKVLLTNDANIYLFIVFVSAFVIPVLVLPLFFVQYWHVQCTGNSC